MQKKIMLLGSGELGREFVIAAKRLGQYVIAVDSYDNAPAQQVADEREVINMLDGEALKAIVNKHQPDIIVPEIEAIRTEKFFEFEKMGIHVVPSAKAVNFTMNRKAIRDLASKVLGINTAKYLYATTLEEFKKGIEEIKLPCVVKPLMSSSGKGQSYVKTEEEVEKAWEYAIINSRGDLKEVIIEEFINFDYEITLLTISQRNGETLFCPPIGHRQERGDYQESWQPQYVKKELLEEAQKMAAKVIENLGGAGLWGVEFFVGKDKIWFSELSPRPHDTGMVTLAGTQNFNEFELHLRAVLGIPINEIKLKKAGASAVILSQAESDSPKIFGLESSGVNEDDSFVYIFGKPSTRKYRRMGVALAYGEVKTDIDKLRQKAKEMADFIRIE